MANIEDVFYIRNDKFKTAQKVVTVKRDRVQTCADALEYLQCEYGGCTISEVFVNAVIEMAGIKMDERRGEIEQFLNNCNVWPCPDDCTCWECTP